MDSQNMVQWIYSSKDQKELQERYDEWAKQYDRDLDEDFGWVGPQLASESLARFTSKEARILDVGAGTGLVGVCLSQMGFKNISAMDMSQGMLDQARAKNVYQDFHQMILGNTLDFQDNTFDALISVGVFTVGHAPAKAFPELVRITKPGGHIAFTLRPDVWEESGFKEIQEQLESDGRWKLVDKSDPVTLLPKGEPELVYHIWTYEVIS